MIGRLYPGHKRAKGGMGFLRIKAAPAQDGLFRLESGILRQPRESQLQRFVGAILVFGELVQHNGHGSRPHHTTASRSPLPA
jgi:hypothetical protein